MMRLPLAVLLAVSLAFAQPSFFRFDFDQDRLSGAPDFSFLNHPLTAADRLFVRDGHFYRVGEDLEPHTEDDSRVRLFGVNLAFSGNFPAPADAVRIARRMRRLGINVVRLHHMDSQPDGNPNGSGSLLTTGPYPTLHTNAVNRLRAFLDALREEGIYVNLNLKVGYQFRPAVDGVPAPAGGIPTQSKPLHVFWPAMVAKQAEFTAKVLDALRLSGDPVLGLVEINNESSLVDSWQRDQLERSATGPYREELGQRWNEYLRGRYAGTSELRQAWAAQESAGPELLGALAWRTELHGNARATIAQTGEASIRVAVLNGSSTAIVKQVGFSLEAGARPYVGVIELRADLPDGVSRGVYWDIKEDVSPWRTVRAQTVQVTNQWQRFVTTFTPSFGLNATGRFAVQVEQLAGTEVEVRNWSLSQPARRGLADGETLEAGNVGLVDNGSFATQARTEDWLRYLVELDRRYLESILAVIREKAGPRVPVAGTQMEFGGLLNLDSHTGLDYQDRHFYVDHYAFPGTAWDGRNWTISEQSHLANGLGSYQNAAATREAGRPYTVSEFNQPWPNTYAAETDPVAAAFAAFQDWDGLMHFAYAHSNNWDIGVPNGFNLNGDWAKAVGFGQAAWLFRTAALAPGRDPLEIPLTEAQRLAATRTGVNGSVANYLRTAVALDPAIGLGRRIAVKRSEEPFAGAGPASPPEDFTYDRAARRFLIHAARAAGAIGFLGTDKVTAGPLEVELKTARGFAPVLLTPLDGQPLAESGRLLLTLPGFTLRTQPGSNPPRPQNLVPYPGAANRFTLEPDQGRPSGDLNGGTGPVWMERIPAAIGLRLMAAARVTVYPLDAAGGRLDPVEAPLEDGVFRFAVNGEGSAAAPWFEVIVER